MNQFTIEFKNSKDLAKKISEYNELMNGPVIQPPEPEPVKTEPVVDEPKKETKPKAEEPKEEKPVPGAKIGRAHV